MRVTGNVCRRGKHKQANTRKEEQARCEAASLWYPLQLRSGASRVDVFGGTGDGWASLLATLGNSLIQAGSSILLVDFSEWHVGGGLAMFAAARGISMTRLISLWNCRESTCLMGSVLKS